MSDKLLNTAEAARFLRVSQASVRRWSDSGLLAARRLGRRRERRFTEADLKRFLAPASGASKATHDGVQKEVFIGGTAVPLHSHVATFYNSDEGRLRLTLPFFREGLLHGQPCFLAAGGEVREAYLAALRAEEGIDVDAAVREGMFVMADGPGAKVDAALGFWERVLSGALSSGPTLIRIVGEMVSERTIFKSDAEMIRYEIAFNGIAKRFPTLTLCQYDARAFDGEVLFHALRAHPDLYQLGIASFLN
jgi:transcriptional repressor of dcmA and dcmR